MTTKTLKRSAVLAFFSILIVISVFSAATYAWFTANREVNTTRVTTSVDTEKLQLLVKAPSDADFSDSCQLESAEDLVLLPVSTNDLNAFVYSPYTVAQDAKTFLPVDQPMYFVSTIEMRAEFTGDEFFENRVAVYLDNIDQLVQKIGADSMLLNAARLGIALEGWPEYTKIFYLSEENNPAQDQILNTVVNDQLQPGNIVLASNGIPPTPVPDPAIPLGACAISNDNSEPLFYLEHGTNYRVRIFFYLEGCDPDCSDSIRFDEADFGLDFYATPAFEE